MKDDMIEVTLNNQGLLVGPDGIKYKRGKPVVAVQCDMSVRNGKIVPMYFEQELLNLQKEGKLKKGALCGNAFLVANRESVENKKTIQRSWGPTDYQIKEICTIEIYELGEQ
jgi:hypothetical protein